MIIYKKDNTIRADLHQLDDSEVYLEISNDEYANVRFEHNVLIPFDTGDYTNIFGTKFTLFDKPAPIEKISSKHFMYTLKMYTNKKDMEYVNIELFDNTTYGSGYDYNPSTVYSIGDKVKYLNVIYKYINPTPSSGQTPSENTYWTVVRTAPQWDFPYVATPRGFAELIVANMNRARVETWTVGVCIEATPKQAQFTNTNCLEAVSSVANLFETEYWLEGTTLNIGKRTNATALTMQYGKGNGFRNLIRKEANNTKKVTRLVALGAEKNLNGTYRNGSRRLMLPSNYYLDSANIDVNNPLEETVTWDDIYPTLQHATADYSASKAYVVGDQVLYDGKSWDCIQAATGVTPSTSAYWKLSEGTITGLVSRLKFIDENITFNPLDQQYRMTDGTMPKVHFETGNMAGYEFPITGYDTLTKTITIGEIQDGVDNTFPAVDYGFSKFDRFNFVDLYMPQTYVTKAEQRLLAKATEYLNKFSIDQVTYSGDVSVIWATENAIELHLGDQIHVIDADLGIDGLFRIVTLRRNITNPYKYEIELSQLPYIPGRIDTIENIVNDNNDYIDRGGINNSMFRNRTYQGAQDALNMAFDPEGDYFQNVIAPLIIRTSQILIGTNSQQYVLSGVEFSVLGTNPNHIMWTSGTLTDSTMEETARAWNIASGTFDAATDPEKTYYCYFKVERGSTTGVVYFSEDQILVKSDNSYYYFLYGTLGKLKDGLRQFWTSNGFTFISGDTIVTGHIKDATGEIDIDLVNKKITFGTIGQQLTYNIDGDGKLKITGEISATSGSIAGWSIGVNSISKNNVTLGADGSIKCVVDGVTYWSLNPDGSGSVGRGGISWNAAGEVIGDFKEINNNGDLFVYGDVIATGAVVAGATNGVSPDDLPVATGSLYGVVKIDDVTIKIDANGKIYAIATGGVSSWNDLTDKPANLTALAALTGAGIVRRNSDGTFTLDTSAYLTAITKAMVENVLTGNITTHTHSQYLTAITKTMVEAVLTGIITSHQHNYLPISGGNLTGPLTILTNTVWHAGNSNKNDVDWTVRELIANTYALHTSPTNPHLKLVLNGLNWYVQLYQDKLYLGYGLANSIEIDQTGATKIPGVCTVDGLLSSGAVVAGALNGTLPNDLPVATSSVYGVSKYSGLAIQPTSGDVALRTKHYTTLTNNSWVNKAYTITFETAMSSPGSVGANNYYSVFMYALPTSKCLACVVSIIPYATGTTPPWIGQQLIASATKDSTGYWRVFIYNPTASAVDLTNVKLSIIAQMIE